MQKDKMKVKKYDDFVKQMNESKDDSSSIEVHSNDTTLAPKVLSLLWQECGGSFEGLKKYLGQKYGQDQDNDEAARAYILNLVMDYMSNDFEISGDIDAVDDMKEFLQTIYGICIQMNAQSIVNAMKENDPV